MTDESGAYAGIDAHFKSHEIVTHSAKEYARGDVTTNTVESSFSLLKRGLVGTFHSVGEQHLQRYVNEFDFRWNTRQRLGFTDTERTNEVIRNMSGKRLTYRRTDAQA
jgi:ISXO2 transposase-like protein